MNKILFIDRDGTLVVEPEDLQVDRLDKIRLMDGVIPALLQLQDNGFQLVMVTNQDGLGTPSFPQADFAQTQTMILQLFSSQGIVFEDILICPHSEAEGCVCRKPQLGLLMDYIVQRRFDPRHSYVIGDRDSDCQLARNMGIEGILINEFCAWPQVVDQIIRQPRTSFVERVNQETNISIRLNLDGAHSSVVDTPCYFLNHMLAQIAKHGQIGLHLTAQGDSEVDDHHLVEDIAICLGQALNDALYDRRGVGRYGFSVPMDESLAQAVIDLSGRGDFFFQGLFPRDRISDLSTEMVPHFFKTLAQNMGATLHLSVEGENTHHMVEACFKVFARVLRQAMVREGAQVASTKGCL